MNKKFKKQEMTYHTRGTRHTADSIAFTVGAKIFAFHFARWTRGATIDTTTEKLCQNQITKQV